MTVIVTVVLLVLSYVAMFVGSMTSSSSPSSSPLSTMSPSLSSDSSAVVAGACGAAAGAAAACSSRRACSIALFSSYSNLRVASYQIHDRFDVLLHLGTTLLDVALDSGPRADEDAQVLDVAVSGSNETSYPCRAAPTANRAAVPSAVDCIVVAIDVYGVAAPIICNRLPMY